tara:strand:+ start:959 stop:1093 length:135 start_codon:yes stop_codon:yes gene_type:complete
VEINSEVYTTRAKKVKSENKMGFIPYNLKKSFIKVTNPMDFLVE